MVNIYKVFNIIFGIIKYLIYGIINRLYVISGVKVYFFNDFIKISNGISVLWRRYSFLKIIVD